MQEPAPAVDFVPKKEVPESPEFAGPVNYGNPHVKAGIPRGLPATWKGGQDTVIDGADFPGLTVRGASIRGDDHRYQKEVRQDAMGMWTLSGPGTSEVLLVCAADGVGSQPFSHRGSMLACRTLHEEIGQHIEPMLTEGQGSEAAQKLFESIAHRMTVLAQNWGMEPKALSTTLVAALVELTPPGAPRRCLAFGVGDSAALLLRDETFTGLWDDSHDTGPISDTATAALPTHFSSVASAEVQLGAEDVLVVCTDGLVNPMRNEDVRAQMSSWWRREAVPGLLEFAWQLSFRAKSFGDDRTAVCVWGR
ncbi:protein phosphatase 2C domain-containing protein [Acrocarpospora corrugata]|nr:protein phosphatase 2C domain-containing protein [Acrocarpospora corrugata]